MSRTWTAVAASAALAVLWLLTTGTQSAWTSAVVAHPSDTARTASLGATHTYMATTCTGDSGTTACPLPLVAGALPATGSTTATDSVSNDSTVAAGLTARVAVVSCGPAQLANTAGATGAVASASHPMLIRNNTTLGQTDKWGTTSAITLGGSAGDYAADGTWTRSGTELTSTSLTAGVWFKVAAGSTAGGMLMSLSATPVNTTGSGTGGTSIWLQKTGVVAASVKPGTAAGNNRVVSTTPPATKYNDGAWHLVVFSIAGTSSSLYVDNAAAVTGTITTSVDSPSYWHLGWGDVGTGPNAVAAKDQPTQIPFAGSLSGAFTVYGAALSNTTTPKVSALYGAASAAAYATALKSNTGLSNLWMLDDSGTVAWTGQPTGQSGSTCAGVDVKVDPTATGGSATAAALSTLPSFAVPVPAAGASTTLTTSVTHNTAYTGTVATFTDGLHLIAPVRYTLGYSAGPTTWDVVENFAPTATTTVQP